jgi:hypothetical protein
MRRTRARDLAAIVIVGLMTAASLSPAQAQQSASPRAEQDATDPAQARALLMRMGDYLAKAPSFSVTMAASYDVVQASGQKIEFDETRSILLDRPNDLRIDIERGNGKKETVLFDGKDVTLFNAGENVFARLGRPGSVDDILHYIVSDLQTRIPLSVLLVTTLPQELQKRVTEVAVVDEVTFGGQPTVHLAARSEDVDFQVWIARGDQPVPVRVVLTYKHAAGQPQFSAMFHDWNFHPKADPASFAFVPPAGAESVAFMVPAAGKAGRSRVGR